MRIHARMWGGFGAMLLLCLSIVVTACTASQPAPNAALPTATSAQAVNVPTATTTTAAATPTNPPPTATIAPTATTIAPTATATAIAQPTATTVAVVQPTATAAIVVTQAVNQALVQRGQAVFTAKTCYICHGKQGEGVSAPRIAGTALSLAQVMQQIRHPRQDMPQFTPDELSDDDIKAIYAFLQSLGKQ